MLDSEGYNQNGNQKLPSRFLKEIGEENYIRVGTISKELQECADKYASALLSAVIPAENDSSKEAGDRVTHPAFGEGTIVGFVKNKTGYIIKFDKLNSERTISADFFNRQKVSAPSLQTAGSHVEKADFVPESFTEKVGYILESLQGEQNKEEADENTDENISAKEENIHDGYEKEVEFPVTVEEKNELPEIKRIEPKKQSNPNEYENLWKRKDVPQTGWVCTGITDLGEPIGICEMCGHQIIRYVHHMEHPSYKNLNVGCVCAGKMEGDVERAKQREKDFKNKQQRKDNFYKRKWKISKNNNRYVKIKDHLIVLYYNKKYDNWKYSIDNVFCPEVYRTYDDVIAGAFEAFDNKLYVKGK